jgi:hypothetical protein
LLRFAPRFHGNKIWKNKSWKNKSEKIGKNWKKYGKKIWKKNLGGVKMHFYSMLLCKTIFLKILGMWDRVKTKRFGGG